MLQYTSELKPWEGGDQLLSLPQTFWGNLGQGFVLCLSCFTAQLRLPFLLCC